MVDKHNRGSMISPIYLGVEDIAEPCVRERVSLVYVQNIHCYNAVNTAKRICYMSPCIHLKFLVFNRYVLKDLPSASCTPEPHPVKQSQLEWSAHILSIWNEGHDLQSVCSPSNRFWNRQYGHIPHDVLIVGLPEGNIGMVILYWYWA